MNIALMGACLTLERDEVVARKRSNEIDKQLDQLAKDRPRILKILLLGAGESGLYRILCMQIQFIKPQFY